MFVSESAELFIQWDVYALAKALVSREGTCIYELEISGCSTDGLQTSKLSMAVGETS